MIYPYLLCPIFRHCYCPLWNKVCIFDAGMAHNDIKRYDVKKIVIILLSFFYYSVNGPQTPDSLRTDTARADSQSVISSIRTPDTIPSDTIPMDTFLAGILPAATIVLTDTIIPPNSPLTV